MDMDEVVIIVRLRKHVTEQAADLVADRLAADPDVESARIGHGRMNGRTLQADAEQS